MPVGKGSIQRAVKVNAQTEQSVGEESTKEVGTAGKEERKAAEGKQEKKAEEEKETVQTGKKTERKPAAKKTPAAKPSVSKEAEEKSAAEKKVQQISHIKSELPVHLL